MITVKSERTTAAKKIYFDELNARSYEGSFGEGPSAFLQIAFSTAVATKNPRVALKKMPRNKIYGSH